MVETRSKMKEREKMVDPNEFINPFSNPFQGTSSLRPLKTFLDKFVTRDSQGHIVVEDIDVVAQDPEFS